jgi:hypothetical protein
LSDCEHTRWLTILSKIEEVLALKIQEKRNRLFRKLSKFCATSPKKPKKPNYKDTHQQLNNFVHNIDVVNLSVAWLGLPSTPPIDDIIVEVDSVLKLVPYEERTSIRSCCKTLLEHGRRNKKQTSSVAPDLKKQVCLDLKAAKETWL